MPSASAILASIVFFPLATLFHPCNPFAPCRRDSFHHSGTIRSARFTLSTIHPALFLLPFHFAILPIPLDSSWSFVYLTPIPKFHRETHLAAALTNFNQSYANNL